MPRPRRNLLRSYIYEIYQKKSLPWGTQGEPAMARRDINSVQTPYDLLLERIVMGDYLPGTSLSEQQIASDLGVSRTPVREALLRLRIEGLVRIIPRGGIFVAEATLRQVRDVTATRLVLEEFLARQVSEKRTQAWLEKFQAWLAQTKKNWDKLSSREWMKRDGEFHALLDEASGNEILAAHLGLLRRQAVLFWAQTSDSHASLHPIITDFEDAMRALQHRNADACAEILQRHVLAHVERIQLSIKPSTDSVDSRKH